MHLLERPGMVLGSSWDVFEGAGDAWVSPERSNCCYLIDFEAFSYTMFFNDLLDISRQ